MAARAVSSSRFKTLEVTERCSIRDFVNKHSLSFKPGMGFYQLTKPETIQVYKEIVVRRKSDGSLVSGDAVRTILGIPKSVSDSKGKFKLSKEKLSDFDVFIQSTSYNRALLPDTEFLYEADDSGAGMSRVDIMAATAAAAIDVDTRAEWVPRGKKGKAKKSSGPIVAPPPPGGPGSPLEIVFSFDTTGSMYSCLGEVRKRVQEVITRLLGDIPGMRIAVFAHGDYCDARSSYVTKYVDFATNSADLCEFVNSVSGTGGGDEPECYELVLRQVQTKLSWSGGTQRSLVMIGDATPHEPSYHLNKLRINWRHECEDLKNMGVRIYSVQCNNNSKSTSFYSTMASMTNGHHLKLDQFSTIIDFILAICYREKGMEELQKFEAEVRKRELKKAPSGGLNSELHNLFSALRVPDASAATSASMVTAKPAAKRKSETPLTAATPAKKGKMATKGAKTATGGKKKPAAKKPAAKKTVPKKATTSATKATGGKKKPATKKPAAKKSVPKTPAPSATKAKKAGTSAKTAPTKTKASAKKPKAIPKPATKASKAAAKKGKPSKRGRK